MPMACGRLNVTRETLFEDALLVTYTPTPDQSDIPAATDSGWMSYAAPYLYRGQVRREGMKDWRWWVESSLGPSIAGENTRNSLMNEPVLTLEDRDPTRVDILHEYFVLFEVFDDFLTACQDVIPDAFVEFLKVTLRFVDSDPDSLLPLSPAPRIAAVMSFTQELTQRAGADCVRMTGALIDRLIAIGGTYYLPYRPHATQPQFLAASPPCAGLRARQTRPRPKPHPAQ